MNSTRRHFSGPEKVDPHEHWHVDVSYPNIAGTFCFLCSVLDGCSRFIVHWEIRGGCQTPARRARRPTPTRWPPADARSGAATKDRCLEFCTVQGVSRSWIATMWRADLTCASAHVSRPRSR